MTKRHRLFFTIALLSVALYGCSLQGDSGTPTPSKVEGPTGTPVPTVTDTPAPTPTDTATPTPTNTFTPMPTNTHTPTPTATDTPTPTPTEVVLLDADSMTGEGLAAGIQLMVEKALNGTVSEIATEAENALAIWNWVKANIASGDDLYAEDEVKAAYTGLKDKKGGVATKNAVFAVLMEAVGMEHMLVNAADQEYAHSWNICKVGGVWYHFDFYMVPSGTYSCFMQTDEQVKAMTADLRKITSYFDLPEGLPERATEAVYNGYFNKWISTPELSMTEKQIREKLEELKTLYPNGKYWNNGGVTDTPCDHNQSTKTCNRYTSVLNRLYVHGKVGGMQCLGFANMLSDAIFGKGTGAYAFTSFDDLKVGDMFRIMVKPDNGNIIFHTAIIIEKTATYVKVAEVNYDYKTCQIRWGGRYTRKYLEDRKTWYISREYNLIEE